MQFQSDYALNPDSDITLAEKQKMDGIKVIDVQRKLKSLGYNCEPTGYRDDRTTQAIKEFQSKSGLEPSGIVTGEDESDTGIITALQVKKGSCFLEETANDFCAETTRGAIV